MGPSAGHCQECNMYLSQLRVLSGETSLVPHFIVSEKCESELEVDQTWQTILVGPASTSSASTPNSGWVPPGPA